MLNRREMLAASGGILLAIAIPFGIARTDTFYGGWLNLPTARRAFIENNVRPFYYQHDHEIKGTGKNKEVLLWKFYEEEIKAKFTPHVQDIGDCVGQAFSLGVDTLTAVQIGLQGRNEEWRGKCSSEAIYAGSRIEIGKGVACFGRFGRPSDGSTGAWAGEYVRDYGVLLRQKYGDVDLTRYRPELARVWGSSNQFGVPDDLETISKPHPVKTVTRVDGWDQACDLIANGYLILLCSNVGFNQETDSDGFLSPGPTWYHAMCLWGIDTKSSREGGCIANSWPEQWVSGPQHRLGTPAGNFWADARVIDRMLKQEDSYALSNYVGYPRQEEIDYRLW